MQDEHREAIQNNFLSLVERTDLEVMASSLYEKGVFSEAMMEPYRDTNKGVRTRKQQLYRDIMRRGPHAFQHLLDALTEAGYWDLARDLDPNSPLHIPSRRDITINPKPTVGGDRYVSISTEKKNEMQKNRRNEIITQPEDEYTGAVATDPSPEVSHFNVIKSTKFKEDNDEHFKLYVTRSRHRGILVVFSYVSFKNNIEEYRHGIDVDCNNLKHLFSEIGFVVLSYMNLSKEETLNTLVQQRNVLEGFECVFIMVSSHGYERFGTSDTDIRCSEGKLISFYEIIEHFNNENSPGLKNIPKVFIFQLCRGAKKTFMWTKPAHLTMPRAAGARTDGAAPSAAPSAAPRHPLRPREPRDQRDPRDPHDTQDPQAPPAEAQRDRVYSDILIAHSTLPGFVSHRDRAKGSWYIQALCEVFAARAHDCHVEELLTLVDKQLQRRFAVQTSSVDKWGFNDRLYLHPGLFED